MAKLTPEQKALNKAATKLRDRAFRQRKDEYECELQAALAPILKGPLAQAALSASKALDDAVAARDAEVSAIQQEIAELERKLAATRLDHEKKLVPIKQARSLAWQAKHGAEKEVDERVSAKYADVARCWSAAGWKSYEEFLPLVAQKGDV